MRLGKLMASIKKRRGFTIIELIVAAVLAGAIVALVYALYVAYSRTILEQQQRWVEIEQVARATVDRLKTYVNYIGQGVKLENGQPLVVFAAPYELGFNADISTSYGEIGSGTVTFGGNYIYGGKLFNSNAETYRLYFPANPTVDYSLSPLDREMRVSINTGLTTYQLSYGIRFDDGSDFFNPDGNRPIPIFTYWGDWDFDPVTPDTLWGDSNNNGSLDQDEIRNLLTGTFNSSFNGIGGLHGEVVLTKADNCGGRTVYNTEDLNCNNQWDAEEVDLNHNGKLDRDLLATQLHRVDLNVTIMSRTKATRGAPGGFKEAKAGLSVYPHNLLSLVLARTCGNAPQSFSLTLQTDVCGGVHVIWDAASDDGKGEDDIVYYKVMRCNSQLYDCSGDPANNPNWRAVAIVPAEGRWRYQTGPSTPQYEYFDTNIEPQFSTPSQPSYQLQYRVYVYDCAGQYAVGGPQTATVTSRVHEAMSWFSENFFMWSEPIPCYRFDGSGSTYGGMALFWPAIYEVPGGQVPASAENTIEYWIYRSIPVDDFSRYATLTDDQLFDTLSLEDPLAKLKPKTCGGGGCTPTTGDAEEVYKNYAYYKFHHAAWQDYDWYMWRDKVDAMGRTGLDFSVLPQNGRIFGVGTRNPTRQYIYWLKVYDTRTGCLSKPIRFRSTFEKANPRGAGDVYRFGDIQTFNTQTSTDGCSGTPDVLRDSRFAPPRWLAPIWKLGQGSDSYVDPLDPSIIEASEVGDPIIPGFQVSWYPSKSEDTTRCITGACSFNDVVEYYVVREEWRINADHTIDDYESNTRVWIGPIIARSTYQKDEFYQILDRADNYGEMIDKGDYKIYYYMWPSKDRANREPGVAGLFAPDFANPICNAPNCTVPDEYKIEWDPNWVDDSGNFVQPYKGYFYYIVGAYRHSTANPPPITPQSTDTLSVGVSAPNRAWWNCSHEVGNLDPNYTYFKQCDLTDYFLISYGWTDDSELAANPGNYEMKLQFKDITNNDPNAPWQDALCLPSTAWPMSVDVCGTNHSGDRACVCRHAPFFGSDEYPSQAPPCDPNNPGAGNCAQRWMPNRKYEYRVLVWRKDEQQTHPECQLAYYVGEAMPGMPNMEAAVFDNKEPNYIQWGIDYSGISPAIDPEACHPDTTNYGEVYFFVWRERREGPDRQWVPDTAWRGSGLPNGGVYITQVNPAGTECWRPAFGAYPGYQNDLCAWDRRTIAADRSFTLRDYRPGTLQYGWDYQYCAHVLIDQDGNGPSDHWVFPSWDTWSDLGCVPIKPVFEILFPVCPTDASLGTCRDDMGRTVEAGDPVLDYRNPDTQGAGYYEKPYDFGDSQNFGNGFRTLVLPPCCNNIQSCPSLGASCTNNICGESSAYSGSAPPYNYYTPFTSGAMTGGFYQQAKGWLCPTFGVLSEIGIFGLNPLGLLLCYPGSELWPPAICNSTAYTCGHQTIRDILSSTYFNCLLDPGSFWVMNNPCNHQPCHRAKQDCTACDPFGIGDFCGLVDWLCTWPACCLCVLSNSNCWSMCCGYTFAECISAIYDPIYCACQDIDCCIFPWAIGNEGSNRALLGLHSMWMEKGLRWISDLFDNDFLNPFDYGSWAGARYVWNHFGAYANPLLDDKNTPRDCSSDAPRYPRENLQNFVMVWDQKVWDSGSLGSIDTKNFSFATSFMLQDVNKTLGQYMDTPSQYLLVHDFSDPNGDMRLTLNLYFGSPSSYTLRYQLDFNFYISIDFLGNHWETWIHLFTITFFDYITRVQGFNQVRASTVHYNNSYDDAWWRNYLLVCRQPESGNEGEGCTNGCNNTHAFAFTAPKAFFGDLDIEKAVLEKSLPTPYSKLYFNSDDQNISLVYNSDPNFSWSNTLVDWDVAWWLRIYVGFPTELGWDPKTVTLWTKRIDRLEKEYLRDGVGRIGFWVEHEMAMTRWLSGSLAPMTAVDNVRVRLYYGDCPPQWMIRNYFSKDQQGSGPGSKEGGQGGGLASGEGVIYAPLTSIIGENIPMRSSLKDKEIEKMLTRPGYPLEAVSVEKIDQMKKIIKQQYTVMRRALPAEVQLMSVPSGFTFGKVPLMMYRDDITGNYVYAKVLTPQVLKTQLLWSQDTIDKFTRRVKEAQLEGRLPFKEIDEIITLFDFPIRIELDLTQDQLLPPERVEQAFGLYAQHGLTQEEILNLLAQNWDKFKGREIAIDMGKQMPVYNVPPSLGW